MPAPIEIVGRRSLVRHLLTQERGELGVLLDLQFRVPASGQRRKKGSVLLLRTLNQQSACWTVMPS